MGACVVGHFDCGTEHVLAAKHWLGHPLQTHEGGLGRFGGKRSVEAQRLSDELRGGRE